VLNSSLVGSDTETGFCGDGRKAISANAREQDFRRLKAKFSPRGNHHAIFGPVDIIVAAIRDIHFQAAFFKAGRVCAGCDAKIGIMLCHDGNRGEATDCSSRCVANATGDDRIRKDRGVCGLGRGGGKSSSDSCVFASCE